MISSAKVFNNRLISMFCLGFASGLPLTLTTSTLQAWFTQANMNIKAVGALTLIGIPYTFKFLWAGVMDHFRIPFFTKRKGWVLLTQLFIVLTLLWMAQLSPNKDGSLMGMVALAIAFFSASQDISIDAYRSDVLSSEERGLGSSYFIFTYRIALLIGGGLSLIFADYWGWRVTYELMAGLMVLGMLFTVLIPQVAEFNTGSNVLQTIKLAVQNLLQREQIILVLLFVLLYKLGDALSLALMTNFLLKGLNFTLTEVGIAYKMMSFIGIILGGIVGGILLFNWSLYRALFIFGLAQAISNLSFVVLAWVGKNFTLMAGSLFLENFCSGLSTAAFLAFLMSLCDKRFTACQFAMLSAIASLGRVFLGPVASSIVEHFGWVQLYIMGFLACFPSLILLFFLKDRVFYHAQAVTE